MKLAGKVAVVTGGSKGIGFGCAKIFGKYGARVTIAARGEEDGKQAEQELVTAGTEAAFVSCDVTRETDMKAVIGSAIDRWGNSTVLSTTRAGIRPPFLSTKSRWPTLKACCD